MEIKTKTLYESQETAPLPKEAQLVLLEEGFPKKYIPLTKARVSLGTAPDNDIQLKDPYISAHHCTIEKKGPLFFLKDETSRNGTFLSNILIRETSLQHKAQIQLGRTYLQFEFIDPAKTESPIFCGMLSKQNDMHLIFDLIKKLRKATETVMIYGETGTGKELIARALHTHSERHRRSFVAVNCSAIPESLLESELFGHVKGAFTGAHKDRAGYFQMAHLGTLFLDEIGEMPLSLQSKLLRVLEQREIRPVGAERNRAIDIRIIAATHRDLSKEVKAGRFRADLFYRLHLIPIHIPPLRNRKEDIPLLVKHFAKETEITSKALKLLIQHEWPGNIRELKNTIDRMKVYLEAPIITAKDVQQVLKLRPKPFLKIVCDFEKQLIGEFLKKNEWNKSETARSLAIPKTTLLDKIKRYDIQPEK